MTKKKTTAQNVNLKNGKRSHLIDESANAKKDNIERRVNFISIVSDTNAILLCFYLHILFHIVLNYFFRLRFALLRNKYLKLSNLVIGCKNNRQTANVTWSDYRINFNWFCLQNRKNVIIIVCFSLLANKGKRSQNKLLLCSQKKQTKNGRKMQNVSCWLMHLLRIHRNAIHRILAMKNTSYFCRRGILCWNARTHTSTDSHMAL